MTTYTNTSGYGRVYRFVAMQELATTPLHAGWQAEAMGLPIFLFNARVSL